MPAGTTTVHFRFLPPHELPAAIVFLVALLALVLPALVRRARGVPGPDPARTGSGRGPADGTVPDGAGGQGAAGLGAGGQGATGAAPVGDSPSD